ERRLAELPTAVFGISSTNSNASGSQNFANCGARWCEPDGDHRLLHPRDRRLAARAALPGDEAIAVVERAARRPTRSRRPGKIYKTSRPSLSTLAGSRSRC